MALLVANGICRYAINGTYGGRQVVNILDMKIDTTGSVVARTDTLPAQAELILHAWTDHVLENLVVDNYVAESVSWVDIDSETGTVGSITSSGDDEWPQAGSGSQTAMPGNVAIRVNKVTSGARGTRQGRMYLCGVAENQTSDENPNSLTAEFASGVNAQMAGFLTDITAESAPIPINDWDSQLHVVHTVEGVYASSSEVTSIVCDEKLGSQRRRLR